MVKFECIFCGSDKIKIERENTDYSVVPVLFRNEEGSKSEKAYQILEEMLFFYKCENCKKYNTDLVSYTRLRDDSISEESFRHRHLIEDKKSFEKKMDDFCLFPSQITRLLIEIDKAIEINCTEISIIGLRSVVERFMTNVKIADGVFVRRLEELLNNGIINKNQKDILSKIIDAGNATTHRAYNPSMKDVKIAFDEVILILRTEYMRHEKFEDFFTDVPKRIK